MATSTHAICYCTRHGQGFIITNFRGALKTYAERYVCGVGGCDVVNLLTLTVQDGKIIDEQTYIPDLNTRYGDGYTNDYLVHDVYNNEGKNVECPAALAKVLRCHEKS